VVNVAPTGNPFNSVVTMSATGLPPGATASFAPPTVIPGTVGTTTNMTIQTARQTALVIPANPALFRYAICFALLLLGFASLKRAKFRTYTLARVTLLA